MLRIGYPLDSHVTYKTDGTPVWDRAISSAPYRKLIKSLFSDGVLPNPSTNLQVSAGTGMKVNLYAGFAICNGCQKLQESNMSLDIATASAVNDRIDTVILRLNDNDDVRECEFYVLTGTPAVAPVRPALTQTDSIWEIGLADVLVKANSTQISNANITDTRYETARCGVISSISEFDTTTLYQQVQADLQEFRDINQAEFIAWVDSLENKLSGDVAGNLQLQIDELNDFVDHGSLYSTNTETFKDLESGFYRLRNYKSDLFPGSAAVIGTMQKNVVGGHHTGTIITTDGVNYTRFADYDSSGTLVSDTGWKKMSVDTLTTMEQVEASTDDSKAVGAGAVKELSSSLTNENSETFNFGVLNGVRGFFTNPSRADDSFIPFSGIEEIFFNTSFLEQFDKSMSLKKGVTYELYIHTACNANGSNNVAVSKTSGSVNIVEEILNKNGQSGFSTCTAKYTLNNITEDSIINARVVNASASLVKVNAFAILLKA